MKIEVTGPQPTQTIDAFPDTPGTADYTINPLTAPGTYTITAGRADGSEQVSHQVTVPQPPPPPSSGAVVSPADGGTVLAPWDGPVRVRWDVISHPEAWYRVTSMEARSVSSTAST